MTTNYSNTFIAVAPDSAASAGTEPKPGTAAAVQLTLLRERPYGYTSDDLMFEAHARRNAIPETDNDAERAAFFARPHACLRASPLVKRYGWGLHHDGRGRVAAYGVETSEYRQLAADHEIKQTRGMRGKRAS
jgi:Family of unknown function (DUF6157)